jgi:hypothetical protein
MSLRITTPWPRHECAFVPGSYRTWADSRLSGPIRAAGFVGRPRARLDRTTNHGGGIEVRDANDERLTERSDEDSGNPRRDGLTRRAALGAMLATGALPFAAPAGVVAGSKRPLADWTDRRWTSSFVELDPVEQFRQVMRIQRSLEDADDILHWYHFIMVAVPKGATPKAVVRWEGIELSRHERIGENRFRLHGHNLSFPRDLRTGAFVDAVKNPVSGRTVSVPPMTLTEDPGLVRSPEGTVTLDKPTMPPRMDYRVLRREGDVVKVDAIRVPPDTWPVTFLETGYEATPAALFDDRSLKWLPSEVSGAYVFPWPKWMEMGDAPGHMFATWSGYKLRSVDQLPDEFRRRAEREFPQLLRVDREQFRRRIEGLTPSGG